MRSEIRRPNPYPGLRSFESDESHLFFGREGLSDEILRRLEVNHFVAVVGSSGSGKSSLVRAGLLPLLCGGFMPDVGSDWRIAVMKPGRNPIRNLAVALTRSTGFEMRPPDFGGAEFSEDEKLKIAVTETLLRRSAVGLRQFAGGTDFAAGENLLVVVDQFEEIFRFKEKSNNGAAAANNPEDEAAAFVKLLVEAVRGEEAQNVFVVTTMRSDFLGDCAQFRDLPETINNGQYLIPRLTRDQLRQAVESPARVSGGARIAPALVTRLLNDIGDDQDQLPVLQHALMRTWDVWEKKAEPDAEIDLAHYEAAGGMTRALSEHADEAFADLRDESSAQSGAGAAGDSIADADNVADDSRENSIASGSISANDGKPENLSEKQRLAVKLFKCLTETDAENRRIRRVVTVGELCEISGANPEDVVSVIETFRQEKRTFLMPPPEVKLDEKLPVDISHESLIRKWGRLEKWVEQEAEDARTYRRLAEDAFQFNKDDDNKGLLTDPELSRKIKWFEEEFKPNAAWVRIYGKSWGGHAISSFEETKAYLEKSKEAHKKEIAEEVERQNELAELRKQAKQSEQLEAERRAAIERQKEIGELTKQPAPIEKEAEKIKPSDSKSKTGEIAVKHVKIEDYYLPEAREILRGKVAPPKHLLDLAKRLKSVKAFNYARRILARAAADSTLNQDANLKLKIHQEWSLCTYQDMDLPADLRLDKALDILRVAEDLETTKNQETLGLLGAIYKRKWTIDNQKMQLERALLYYERGYREGAAGDQGYTGINAAFVLDLLAHQEEGAARKVNLSSTIAKERQAQARFIREDLARVLPPLLEQSETKWLAEMWWFYSTVAEAYFGLQEYENAVQWLNRGKGRIGQIPDWEIESTTSQLARLAILQGDPNISGDEFQNTPAWSALRNFFGSNAAAARSAFVGKIGLALSGGGFRASLFHIGMLAKLAELDVLRQVEVLSCVSGGSIIGAHYYLEVRHLLQSKTDAEITRQDYIDIVRRIEKDFLAGVQRNVRMRIAAEPLTNLRMIFSSAYSRSMRAGELYEEEIFSRVKDGGGSKPRYLNELNVYPKGESRNFEPKLYNWRRAAKAPVLILNATTLNTGHNWQFTTSWMGEPPSSIDTEIDTNDQLRRMYYEEAPEAHRRVRLGHAVSASAAVPGIFEPLNLENLYPDRVVRLADGGGTDNQGLGGLLEQDCTVVLVSDGSGQMESENEPSGGILGVLLRSSGILQARIRNAQYHDLERRLRSSLLRGLMFIHLKEDLDPDPVDWVGCLDPVAGGIDARVPARRGILTRYGIAKEIQTRLAAVRTDLDSFSDVEACALMTSAYRMTENAFVNTTCVTGLARKNYDPVEWKFLEIEEAMKGTGEKYQFVARLLDTSNMLAFKIFRQLPPLKHTKGFLIWLALVLLMLAILVSIVWMVLSSPNLVVVPTITLGAMGKWILGLIVIFVATLIFGSLIKIARWRETLARIAFGVIMSVFGWLTARIHLHIFDRMFLNFGSLDNFRRQGSKEENRS